MLPLIKQLKVHFGAPYAASPTRPWALVLGASGAIGSETASTLYALGFSLLLAGRSSARLSQLKTRFKDTAGLRRDEFTRVYDSSLFWSPSKGGPEEAEPQEIRSVVLDLGDGERAAETVDRALAQLPSLGRLHVVVACAGSVEPCVLSESVDNDSFLRSFHVQLESTIRCVQRCVRDGIMANDRGSIVFVTSLSAVFSSCYGQSAHVAASAGRMAFAEALYEETRLRGIRVCSLLVSDVNTPLVDTLQSFNLNVHGRGSDLVQPSDVARAVVFVSSTRTAVTQIQLQSHWNPSRGLSILSRKLSELAFPKRPSGLRTSGPGGRPTAIVTGGSQGIGFACAQRLARDGYAVALVSRSPGPLQKACTALAQEAVTAAAPSQSVDLATASQWFRPFPCDVGDRAKFDATLSQILEWLGRVDVLVANAGTNRRRSMLNADWKITMSVVDTNFGHMAIAANRVAPWMAHQTDGGTIAFTSSRGGGGRQTIAFGDPGVAPYFASKSALIGFGSVLFEDVREHKIKVVQLCAGLVRTPLGTKPMGQFRRKIDPEKMIQAEEIADELMFAVNCSPTCCATRLVSQALVPFAGYHRHPSDLKRPDNRALRSKL